MLAAFRDMTDVERMLWRRLRDSQLGFRFRRQVPLGSYIADFVCHDPKFIVELDGGQHSEQMEYDEARTAWLVSRGFEVLRFWNFEVAKNLDGVVEAIFQRLEALRNSKGC